MLSNRNRIKYFPLSDFARRQTSDCTWTQPFCRCWTVDRRTISESGLCLNVRARTPVCHPFGMSGKCKFTNSPMPDVHFLQFYTLGGNDTADRVACLFALSFRLHPVYSMFVCRTPFFSSSEPTAHTYTSPFNLTAYKGAYFNFIFPPLRTDVKHDAILQECGIPPGKKKNQKSWHPSPPRCVGYISLRWPVTKCKDPFASFVNEF